MTDAQKKKRNHWVSQSYLRPFAEDSAGTRIWRFSRIGGEPERKRIDKVAVQFYLYAPLVSGIRDYSFEARLSRLEQLFGSALWKALCTDFVDLNDPDLRKALSLLCAVTYLRNPLRLADRQYIHRELARFIAEGATLPEELKVAQEIIHIDKSSWPAYANANDEEIKRSWIKYIGGATRLASLLMRMRWAVTCSDTPKFITTDNPVVALDAEANGCGFRNSSAVVLFALSPTRVLSMDWKQDEPDGNYYVCKDNGSSVNILLWRNAKEYMFSARHPDVVCAEIVHQADAWGMQSIG